MAVYFLLTYQLITVRQCLFKYLVTSLMTSHWRRHFLSKYLMKNVLMRVRLHPACVALPSRWWFWFLVSSDVVLETRVLVLRRLEDKNESLGLGLGSWSLEHTQSWRKRPAVFKTCCNSWQQWARHTMTFCETTKAVCHLEAIVWENLLRSMHNAHQPQLRGYLTMGAVC